MKLKPWHWTESPYQRTPTYPAEREVHLLRLARERLLYNCTIRILHHEKVLPYIRKPHHLEEGGSLSFSNAGVGFLGIQRQAVRDRNSRS